MEKGLELYSEGTNSEYTMYDYEKNLPETQKKSIERIQRMVDICIDMGRPVNKSYSRQIIASIIAVTEY